MKINKPKWWKRIEKKRREKEERKFQRMAEKSYQIVHRIPTVGDTTLAYDYDEIINTFLEGDLYASKKISSGIRVDALNGKFLEQDIAVKYMIMKALLLECRERHRQARISIDEEKAATKRQLEFELKELQKQYDEMCEERRKK